MNRRRILAGSGVAVLVLAVAMIALGSAPAPLAVIARDAIVLGIGALAAVLALVVLSGAAVPSPDADREIDVPALETDPMPDRTRAGETIDAALERTEIGEQRSERYRRRRARREARERVRRTATATLADRHGISRADATARVRDGSWTDDPRAAAFLADDVSLPRRLRLHDWAFGVRYQRGLEAAIAEIERLDADRDERDDERLVDRGNEIGRGGRPVAERPDRAEAGGGGRR